MTMYGYVNIGFVMKLMVVFLFKHFIADFLLQGKYMLGKFKETGWIMPLAAHCGVHAAFTFFITLYFMWDRPKFVLLAYVVAYLDFSIHFIMDRVKASPFMMGQWKNFTKDGYDFISHGFWPPNMFQLEVPDGPDGAEPFISPKPLEPGDKEYLMRSNTLFWWALGFDQLVHGLTDVAIIYILVTYS